MAFTDNSSADSEWIVCVRVSVEEVVCVLLVARWRVRGGGGGGGVEEEA